MVLQCIHHTMHRFDPPCTAQTTRRAAYAKTSGRHSEAYKTCNIRKHIKHAKAKVAPRFELGFPDSKSDVLNRCTMRPGFSEVHSGFSQNICMHNLLATQKWTLREARRDRVDVARTATFPRNRILPALLLCWKRSDCSSMEHIGHGEPASVSMSTLIGGR